MMSGCQSFLTGLSEGITQSNYTTSNCTSYCVQYNYIPRYRGNCTRWQTYCY